MRLIITLLLFASLSFAQVSLDTTISKADLFNITTENESLKLENKELRKELNRINAFSAMKRIKRLIKARKAKGLERVYYIMCEADTAKIIKKYSFFDPSKWDISRASSDSTCRIIEQWLDKAGIKEVNKAYKKGFIKIYGIYPDLDALRSYINDPSNGFIIQETP